MDVEQEIQDVAAVQHQILNLLDLHLVPAPVKEPAVVLVVEGIAGDSENPLLESCEFKFELDLVHRTIVELFCILFHAAKLRHEDAKEWRGIDNSLHVLIDRNFSLVGSKFLRVEHLPGK